MQEDAVERVTEHGLQPEAHVGDTENCRDTRQLSLDSPDGLDGLDSVLPEILLAGAEGKGEAVEDQIRGVDPILPGGEVVDPATHTDLPVRSARLTFLVDGEADHARAVVPGEGKDLVEPRAGALTLLEVCGVEDALTTGMAQAGLHDLHLGGVEHQGERRLGREPAGHDVHVDRPVAADVVDADIEDVRPLLDLVAGHLNAGVDVAFEQGVAELPRAVGVGPLSDDQERGVLLVRDVGVEGCAPRLERRLALDGHTVQSDLVHDCPQVVRCRSTATTDDVHSELGHEALVGVCKLCRCEVVMRASIDDRRETSVRETGDECPRVLAQVSDVFDHLRRAGRTVEADDIGTHGLEGGERRADLGAQEHPTGGLYGDLDHQWDVDAHALHHLARREHRGLALEHVLDRLDEDRVDSAVEQSFHLGDVRVTQLDEADVAEGRELGPRADRADHEPWPTGSSVVVGGLSRDARRLSVEVTGLIGDAVFGEDDREGAEGGGLDGVHAELEELVVHLVDHVGSGTNEVLVTTLERGAPEVLRGQVTVLDPGAERPVEDDDALAQRGEEVRHRGQATGVRPG